MKKIAILYICTVKYEIFWDEFYQSCKKNFYTNEMLDFYVFSDSKRILELKSKDVHTFYQVQSGWPYDTLLRFQWFAMIQDKLKNYDYCYYFNANSLFLHSINEAKIPFPDEKEPLIFWCHTKHIEDFYGLNFNPERNPNSTAYVKAGEKCRCFGGGFFGGLSESFIKMCNQLRDNIQIDLNNGIIAVWHDQSHIIHYATKHPHKEVQHKLISEEEYIPDRNELHIVFLSKSNFGGNDALRDVSIFERLKHLPRNFYGGLLKLTEKFGGTKILRKFVHFIFKRYKL